MYFWKFMLRKLIYVIDNVFDIFRNFKVTELRASLKPENVRNLQNSIFEKFLWWWLINQIISYKKKFVWG